MLQRIKSRTRKEWLEKRRATGIGASEASAALGMNPWLSNTELYDVVTGRKEPKDLSGNEMAEFGSKAEQYLRGLFAVQHPEYEVEYHPYDMLYQDERPWLFCTLDGELVGKDGKRGILEIKTASIGKKSQAAEWDGKIKDTYYIQILSQMLSTGYDFVWVIAMLRRLDGSSELRQYRFDRAECEEDLKYLEDKLDEFYGYVERGEEPPRILPEI